MSMENDSGKLRPEIEKDKTNLDGRGLRYTYAGQERRLDRRRRADDRRNNLRFEPGKCIDRREHCDRRIVAHNYHPTVN